MCWMEAYICVGGALIVAFPAWARPIRHPRKIRISKKDSAISPPRVTAPKARFSITKNLQCVTYKTVNELESMNQVALSCPRVRQGLWKAIHFQVPTEAFLERPSSTNNILQHLSVVTMNVTCWFLQLYPRPSPPERTQYLQSLFLSARSYSHQGARKQKPQNSAGI